MKRFVFVVVLVLPILCHVGYAHSIFFDLGFLANNAYGKEDINCDGIVDSNDIVDITDYIVGKNPKLITETSADVNGDGKVDMADVVMVINAIINFDDSKYIIVDINGKGDYTSLEKAINHAGDSYSENKDRTIIVMPGTYQMTEIATSATATSFGNRNLNIIGIDR